MNFVVSIVVNFVDEVRGEVRDKDGGSSLIYLGAWAQRKDLPEKRNVQRRSKETLCVGR